MNEQLSLRRLVLLLRTELLRNQRTWLIAAGTAALVALLLSSLGALDGDVGGAGFYPAVFIAALFALGTLVTSQAFAELHGRATNTAFLMLPASALEKTLVRLLLTTVGIIFCLLVLTTVLSWAIEGINTVAFGVRRELFVPWDRLAWTMLPHYLVVHGLFFLGAAWFRKLHYIKTVGAVLLIWFGLSTLVVSIAWVAGQPILGGELRIGNFDTPLVWLTQIAKIVYYFALPVFCWFVAWLRVSETQVSHGI
jgi:hypothetical protein